MATFVMRSSHLFITTLIIATFGVQFINCFKSSDYSNHVQLSDAYNVYWTVVSNATSGDFINLALSVNTTGWVRYDKFTLF